MKQKIASLFLAALLCFSFVALGSSAQASVDVSLADATPQIRPCSYCYEPITHATVTQLAQLAVGIAGLGLASVGALNVITEAVGARASSSSSSSVGGNRFDRDPSLVFATDLYR